MQKNYVQEILNIIHGNIPQAELAEKLSDYHKKDLADALEALMPDGGRTGVRRKPGLHPAAYHPAADPAGHRHRLDDDLHHRFPGTGNGKSDRSAQHTGGLHLYRAGI